MKHLIVLSCLLLSAALADQAPSSNPSSAAKSDSKSDSKPRTPDLKEPLTLTLSTQDSRIKGGVLQTLTLAGRYPMPAQAVQRSRKFEKISSTLEPAMDALFKRLSARQARSAYFRNVNGNWIGEQQIGWQVNASATRQNVLEAIRENRNEAKIVLELTPPKRSLKDFAGRGILYHFGGGSSSYAGSPDFRVKNILVGANKLDSRYIEDGEEFDFAAYVGEIDRKNGFVPGLVIAGGTLELEDGGGICQVSTTIFRAAYNAGLPITERAQHSHRVRYYDPVGFEATVYAPQKNLKFRNDTGKPLFIQASYNTRAQTLRFDLFGIKPDRKVKVSAPQISNFKAPANPSYSADPEVALGRARRIDVPMQGMTAVIQRRVVLSSGKVRKDTLKSVYQPWGAVYAVNPADPRAKQ